MVRREGTWGHGDPGFTLRTYPRLMPNSQARMRRAIDEAFRGATAGGEPETT